MGSDAELLICSLLMNWLSDDTDFFMLNHIQPKYSRFIKMKEESELVL